MTTEVIMPQLGESVTEGTIGRWLKKPGDHVARYEPLAEVITDKVNAELPSPCEGVIAEIQVPEGETVEVGRTLALIEEKAPVGAPLSPSLSPRDAPGGEGEDRGSSARSSGVAPSPPRAPLGERDGERGAAPSNGDHSIPRTSPFVRRLAKEHGVDLAQIQGTGMGGRVTKDDILGYLGRRDGQDRESVAARAAETVVEARPAAARAEPVPPKPVQVAAGDREIPVSPMRRTIAQRMSQSAQTIPDAWLMVEVDVTGLVRLRERAKEEFRQRTGVDLTYLPFVARCVVEALAENPILNSTWAEDRIVVKRDVNLGIAVALEDGLVVPVVRNAERLNLTGLAHAISEIVGKARAGKLSAADVQGGTFTLNNSGSFGSIASHPIINYPQAAILNMEAIVKRPVVVSGPDGDSIAIRSMMNLCLSFDHRVMDGAQAGRFLQGVRQRLEQIGVDTPIW